MMPQPNYDQTWLERYSARAKGSVKTRLEENKGFAIAKCDQTTGVCLPPPKKAAVPQTLNPLALKVIRAGRLPEPIAEYKFFESRKFKFDFAWVEQKVALEAEGMVHRIKSRFHSDIEKYNLALEQGWRVYRASRRDLEQPEVLLKQLRKALKP